MTRLVDKPTVEVSTLIDAPVEAVWPLVSDINISSEFQDEFQRAEWLDDVGLGARFRGYNERRDAQWDTTCHVIAYEEYSVFGWAVEDPNDPVATWTFSLEPDAEGTRLTYTRVVGTAPSGLSSAIEKYPDREEEFIARRDAEHHDNMSQVVQGIRRLAEAD